MNHVQKAQIVAIARFWCAAGAPPHVDTGTRHTHFTSNLEEPRSSIAIILARNVCARHFGDVTRCDVPSRFLNGRATWCPISVGT